MFQKLLLLSGTLGLALVGVLLLAAPAGGAAWAATDPTPTLAPVAAPVMGEFDPASVAGIDLEAYPIVPEIGEQARAIYAEGLALGHDPHSFAKVGDCMTDDPGFLIPLGEGSYDLGEYASLEAVIAHYTAGEINPFTQVSQAAAGGFNAASVLDNMWANPEFCEAGESPLSCEFRRTNPGVALVLFGTNDVYYLTDAQFDFFLRSILAESIENRVLPIVSTFPPRSEFPEQSVLFNQIIVKAAEDYGVPLINLWRALEPLPTHGLDPDDSTHLTSPDDGSAGDFSPENLQTGFTVRNLVTLQALSALLEGQLDS
ncbi:MAG: hypothetical protein GXY36_06310 [Chloroflexi bacterium]|nr:hypothetical protein [Chloroflexota bacterium]